MQSISLIIPRGGHMQNGYLCSLKTGWFLLVFVCFCWFKSPPSGRLLLFVFQLSFRGHFLTKSHTISVISFFLTIIGFFGFKLSAFKKLPILIGIAHTDDVFL